MSFMAGGRQVIPHAEHGVNVAKAEVRQWFRMTVGEGVVSPWKRKGSQLHLSRPKVWNNDELFHWLQWARRGNKQVQASR